MKLLRKCVIPMSCAFAGGTRNLASIERGHRIEIPALLDLDHSAQDALDPHDDSPNSFPRR